MINRRMFTLAASVGALASHVPTFAQTTQGIRLIVGFPAGQSSDAMARLVAINMSEELQQTIWVDNKPGASGIIAHELAKAAAADGQTLLLGSTTTLALNPWLYPKLPYSPTRDFDVVGLLSVGPMYLFAAANSPVNNVKEFFAYVKARPGKVAYGSGGNGLTNHVTMEMLKGAAGLDMLHVPYKGSPPMIADLLGGRIDFAFEPSVSIIPLAQSGRVKLIGVASLKREALTPDVPAIAEELPGFRAEVWSALVTPKGTPQSSILKLNAALNKALRSNAVVAEFKKVGASPLLGSATDAEVFIRSEAERWGKVVRDAKIHLDS